jgi:uncharacterized protein YqeY
VLWENPPVSFLDQIEADLRSARLRRDDIALAALGLLKTELVSASKEKGRDGEVDDALALRVTRSEVKRREEAAEAFRAAGRGDRADREAAEAAVLTAYLPEPIDDAALEVELRRVIDEVRPAGPQGFGAVMKAATERLRGRADGSRVAQQVRRLLEG